MKKTFIAIITIFLLFIIMTVYGPTIKTSFMQKKIANKLIRFHVIANSDLNNDQKLKLKVRNEVLKYMTPKLKNSKSLDDSRKIIIENDDEIRKISERVIKENGYKYALDTTLSHENFPVKTYGSITLPAGEYEAYRIIIGEGKGQNWWCIMFPPLCFVDITKGNIAQEETEKEMKAVFTDEEYKAVDNTVKKDDTNKNKANKEKSKGENKVVVKFKIFELIREVFNI
ncbi:stage II sporulation protein R [Clostridium peptidivorans]|uniref:stage II sporulation protein R n=1 Tax=Clostridium peptidivorans TaxID=100174 RepID=UPI000BE45CF7|nr:stage II sporulation protein R [Clostridium peptidivorans]